MINNVNTPIIPQILSDKAHELYRKFKTFLMKVYSMIKYRNDVGDLKEEFWQSYTGFARKLKEVGYENECYAYMDICVMYYHLMDRPDELLAHKEFFADLYESLRICCTQGLTILRIMRKNMMSIVSVSENLATISILKLQF